MAETAEGDEVALQHAQRLLHMQAMEVHLHMAKRALSKLLPSITDNTTVRARTTRDAKAEESVLGKGMQVRVPGTGWAQRDRAPSSG